MHHDLADKFTNSREPSYLKRLYADAGAESGRLADGLCCAAVCRAWWHHYYSRRLRYAGRDPDAGAYRKPVANTMREPAGNALLGAGR
jgi:hypothetical protein